MRPNLEIRTEAVTASCHVATDLLVACFEGVMAKNKANFVNTMIDHDY
jgi:hypothetical protein